MHRTKCGFLNKNVIAAAMKEELKKDICGQKFCLLVDETTDHSVTKVLSVLIKYFSTKSMSTTTALLGMAPIVEVTGQKVFEAVQHNLAVSDEHGLIELYWP